MAKIHKFGLANSLLDSPMATWLTGTLVSDIVHSFFDLPWETLALFKEKTSTWYYFMIYF